MNSKRMKIFHVVAKTIAYPTIDVRASSKKEAFIIAENFGEGSYKKDYDSTWEFISAEEVRA